MISPDPEKQLPDRRPLLGLAVSTSLVCTLLLGAPAAQAEGSLPQGTFVDEALVIDLTDSGFDFLLQPIVDALPDEIVVGSTPPEELVDLWICSETSWMENLQVSIDLQVADLQSHSDQLRLTLEADVTVNSASDPGWLVLNGCINDNCSLWVDPARIDVIVPMQFSLATRPDGQPYVDLEFGEVVQTLGDAITASMNLGACDLTSINAFLFEYLGVNLFESMVDDMVADIDVRLEEALLEVEEAVESAFDGLWLEGSAELAGAPLNYILEPSAVEHGPYGIRLTMGGSVQSGHAPCVEGLDPGGSPATPTEAPPPFPTSYHLRSLVGDDLPNQALYSLWRAGAFCFEAASLGETPLTIEMMPLLVGEEVQPVLERVFQGDDTSVVLRVTPTEVPRVRYDGAHDLMVELSGLQVEVISHLLDRDLRIAALGLDLGMKIDLSLDPSGALLVSMALDEDSLAPSLDYNEVVPELGTALQSNFGGLIQMAMEMVAGDLLGDLQLAMPTVAGIGLTELYLAPEGQDLDVLALSLSLGPSTGGEGAGCDELGCGLASDDAGACGMDGSSDDLGCDLQGSLAEAGCSGATGNPEEPGCDVLDAVSLVSCSLDARSAQARAGDPLQLRIAQGKVSRWSPRRRTARLSLPLSLGLAFLLLAARRRRTRLPLSHCLADEETP